MSHFFVCFAALPPPARRLSRNQLCRQEGGKASQRKEGNETDNKRKQPEVQSVKEKEKKQRDY